MSKRIFLSLLLVCLSCSSLCLGDDQFAARFPRYHLHPGDVIAISYRYSPEYNATATLQPDGFVSLPLVGDINLGGLDLTEARTQLVARASQRLNDPEVNIDLKDFERPYYIVGGQVAKPGKFEVHGPITALRAVEIAGGITVAGKSSQILLIRPINNVDAETRLINLKDVVDHHNLREDIEVHAGDVLIVPKTRIAKAEPFIRLASPSTWGFYIPLGL